MAITVSLLNFIIFFQKRGLKRDRGRERGGGNHAPSFLFHYFFNIHFIIFFQKCIYQKVSEIVINHTPPPPPPGLKRETVMTLVGVLVMTMEGFHSKDSWWAKEGDSYDYGKDFIVRILGGLAPSSLFHYFFNIHFIIFFSKMYLPKSVRNCH